MMEADLNEKQELLCSVFPEKIIFDKNEYRTPKLNEAVELLCNVTKDCSEQKKDFKAKMLRSPIGWKQVFKSRTF